MSPIIGITIMFSILMVGLLIYSMWTQYQDTVYWEDHHEESIVMAKQPPSLLYDPDIQSQDAKMNFLSIYHTIYDDEIRDFTNQVEQSAIEQMSIELGHMTDDEYKDEYVMLFDEIGKKWNIERQYRDLYQSGSVIAENVTPHKIMALNEEVYPLLDTYSKDSWNKDQFAIRIYEWQHALLEDAKILNNKALQLSNWLIFEDDEWKVQPDLYPEQFNNYVEQISETDTTFEWTSASHFNSIIEAIKPITRLYAERHDLYNRIQEDQAEMETAMANVEQQLETAKANLNQELNAIESEKTTLIASADTLIEEQSRIKRNMITLENNAVTRAQAIRNSRNQARLDEQRRLEEERQASQRPQNEWQNQEAPEEPVLEEEEYTQDEELLVHHGKPAKEVFRTIKGNFTYERRNVNSSLDGGIIENHYLNEDGNPHFIIVPSES